MCIEIGEFCCQILRYLIHGVFNLHKLKRGYFWDLEPYLTLLFYLFLCLMQAIHRHIPIIIGALGPLYPELLSMISDPPEGSENLLTQVGLFSIFNHQNAFQLKSSFVLALI